MKDLYNEFDESGLNFFVHEYIVPKIIKKIPMNKYKHSKLILDLGCGKGELSQNLHTDDRIVGFDVSIKNLKSSQKNSKGNITFILGDARYLPFKKDTFDCCFCIGVLHHIDDFQRTILEISITLKKGGILCGTEPNMLSPHLTTLVNIGSLLHIRGVMSDERPINIAKLKKSLACNNLHILWYEYLLGLKFLIAPFELILKPNNTLKLYKVIINLDFLIPSPLRNSFLFIAEKI